MSRPRYIIEGALPPSPSPPSPASATLDLVLGVELAKMLGLAALDTQIEIQLIADPAVGVTADTPYRPARVVGLLGSGLAEYDYRLVLARFADTQALLGRGDAAMGLELLLDAETAARRVAGALETKLGAGYQATDWCDLNKAFLGCTWNE